MCSDDHEVGGFSIIQFHEYGSPVTGDIYAAASIKFADEPVVIENRVILVFYEDQQAVLGSFPHSFRALPKDLDEFLGVFDSHPRLSPRKSRAFLLLAKEWKSPFFRPSLASLIDERR